MSTVPSQEDIIKQINANFYPLAVLRELEVLLGSIIDGHSLKNIVLTTQYLKMTQCW